MIYTIDTGMTAAEAAIVTGGRLEGRENLVIDRISTDSRDKNSGMFIAVRGERFDGHDFTGEAIKNGASCCLVSRGCDTSGAQAVIYVGDTVAALGALARFHRRRVGAMTVAVTGSVGKTTTKQFIYAVLSEAFDTHKTEGNLNNQIGLPLTLLGLKYKNRASVLEFGMSAKGEISALSRVAEPDMAVITNIGSSHIGYLGSRENIRDAKMEIIDGLRSGGKLFLNGNEPLLAGMEKAIYVGFGNSEGLKTPDILIGAEAYDNEGSIFDLDFYGKKIREVEIPAIGRHNVYNAALAFGVGEAAGMDGDTIRRGLKKFKNTGMRQNIANAGDITVIEDCYNAGPESMASALEVLSGYARRSGGRSAAVLGDMRELGGFSEALHLGVGKKAAESGADMLFTFGEEARFIARGAALAGMKEKNIYIFEDISDAAPLASALADKLSAGDTVLFKASRAVELERAAAIFRAYIAKKSGCIEKIEADGKSGK